MHQGEFQSLTSEQDAQVEKKQQDEYDENYLDTALEDPLVWPDSHHTAYPEYERTSANGCGYEGNGDVQSLTSEQDAQVEKKQQDEYDENYLDTALEDPLVWPDSHHTAYPEYERTSANGCGYEGNGSNPNCKPYELVAITTTNQPTKFSKTFSDVSSNPKFCTAKSNLSIDYASLDCQYSSECVNSIQTEETGGFSLFSNKYNSNNNETESSMDTSNTVSVYSYISGKLVESGQFESVQFNSGLNSFDSVVTHSAHSESSSESGYSSRFGSALLDTIRSAEPHYKLCRSSRLEDPFYSAQSELPELLLQNQIKLSHIKQPESIPSPCYCPKEFDATSSDGVSESQFSLQPECFHSLLLEKGPYSVELISPPCECTEDSELALSDGRGKLCFSTLLESCQSDSLRKYHCSPDYEQFWYCSLGGFNHSTLLETFLFERSGEAVYVTPTTLSQSDKDIKSKVAFAESTIEIGPETQRFNMATTEQGVHEEPNLIRQEVICEGIQKKINVNNREECMSVEWMQLQTFQNYPVTAHGSPVRLAREGFFYTGQGMQTRCFSCGVSHGEWNYFDNPHEVSPRLSPNCPFLNGRQEGYRKIPTSSDGSGDVGRADRDTISSQSLPFGSDTGQSDTVGSILQSREMPRASKITDEDDTIGQQLKLGSRETTPRVQSYPVEESAQSKADKRPKFPGYISRHSHIATFSHGCPPYLDQTPQQIAEAGFSFTGDVQSLTSEQDAQGEKKQQDEYDENYLDTALEDPLVWPDSHHTAYPEYERTSANGCGYEGNGSNSLCGIYSNCNPCEPVGLITTTNQPTKFSKEFTKAYNTEIDLSIDLGSLDGNFANSLHRLESGGFSSFSNKFNSIDKHTDSLQINTSYTEPLDCDISGNLVMSGHFESVQIHLDYSTIPLLYHSGSESGYSSIFESVSLDSKRETKRSTWPLFKSCRSSSLEDPFYSAQSELPEFLLQNQSRACCMIPSESSCYYPTEFENYGPGDFSHSTHPEASFYDRSGESVYVIPKILVQSDNEMESISLSHCLSPHGQRQSEIQPVISDQVSNKSDKSHDFAFFKTTNADILFKSKVTFDESAFEIGHETGRFNMATTELSVHEKQYLIRLGVICERTQGNLNVQNRVYYWHQVMQLYFTFMTDLSFGTSLNWLFQFQPAAVQALQRLQSLQIYPFTNLNEFFNCESRDSPPSAEECMSVEWMRLQTFQNYPVTAHGSPVHLAKEGFFYTGQGMQTKCFCCGVSYGEWNFFDNPHEVHWRLSPSCAFLNGRQDGHRNIPMRPDGSGDVGRANRESIPPPSLPFAPSPGSGTGQSQAEGSRSVSSEIPKSSKSTDEGDTIGEQQTARTRETTTIHQSLPVEESAQSETNNRPKFPEYILLSRRIATFHNHWPPDRNPTAGYLADAGFFFTGNQDDTMCYHCGGGIRGWDPEHIPWEEHCLWYPTCPHVQNDLGQDHVDSVLQRLAEQHAVRRAQIRRNTQYGIVSNDPLETLAAITLLEMGYPQDTVRNSILILRRQREPAAEITALEVLDFIWKEEDIERQRQEEEASRPRRPGDAQPPALPTVMEHLNLGGSPAVTQGIISALGTSSTTSASGATQSTNATSPGQGKDEGKGQNTTVGGNGNTRGRLMQGDEFEELQEENKRLKEQITCKICMENQISVVFLPCGHFVCCEVCAPAFQTCLICDRHIQQSVRTSVNP